MTLWLILTTMTSAAVVWLVVPLLRRSDRPQDEVAGDIAVYEDQLQEVARDLRDARIDAAEAETRGPRSSGASWQPASSCRRPRRTCPAASAVS
jgi:cytochrome c-type biogenesis protein CcmH/NrfG